jgi:hypothetical protein
LCNELEAIAAKSEVMDEASSGTEKKNVVFKNWQTSEYKRYRNKREDTHMSQFSISTKNRYDVLSNPTDYSLIGDELSLETDQVRLLKKGVIIILKRFKTGRTSKVAVLDHLDQQVMSLQLL